MAYVERKLGKWVKLNRTCRLVGCTPEGVALRIEQTESQIRSIFDCNDIPEGLAYALTLL